MTRWNVLGKGLSLSAVALAVLCANGMASGSHKKHAKKSATKKHVSKSAPKSYTGAEVTLLGVSLYDGGTKVLSLYGSPDEIQAVTLGGSNTTAGGGGGFGGPAGGGGGGAPARRGGAGGKAGGPGEAADIDSPFSFGDDTLRQFPPSGPGGFPGQRGPGQGAPTGAPGGFPGAPGSSNNPGGGGGLPSGGGGAAERVQYTRWVYNRDNSKYGFIIDKTGHVVQIEAIGMTNPKVTTKRGITFGSSFASIIKAYSNPDGYEIAGDNLLVKFLVKSKVAFRMSRLEAKKPHVVTGIVVAAGKS